MRRRRATGRPSRLTADQVSDIRKMYFEGAAAYGFSSDRWTTGRLASAIEKRFTIHYDQDHVGRLMHKFGLRERRFEYTPAERYDGSRYSPNTRLSVSDISPTLA
jgi:transposase